MAAAVGCTAAADPAAVGGHRRRAGAVAAARHRPLRRAAGQPRPGPRPAGGTAVLAVPTPGTPPPRRAARRGPGRPAGPPDLRHRGGPGSRGPDGRPGPGHRRRLAGRRYHGRFPAGRGRLGHPGRRDNRHGGCHAGGDPRPPERVRPACGAGSGRLVGPRSAHQRRGADSPQSRRMGPHPARRAGAGARRADQGGRRRRRTRAGVLPVRRGGGAGRRGVDGRGGPACRADQPRRARRAGLPGAGRGRIAPGPARRRRPPAGQPGIPGAPRGVGPDASPRGRGGSRQLRASVRPGFRGRCRRPVCTVSTRDGRCGPAGGDDRLPEPVRPRPVPGGPRSGPRPPPRPCGRADRAERLRQDVGRARLAAVHRPRCRPADHSTASTRLPCRPSR